MMSDDRSKMTCRRTLGNYLHLTAFLTALKTGTQEGGRYRRCVSSRDRLSRLFLLLPSSTYRKSQKIIHKLIRNRALRHGAHAFFFNTTPRLAHCACQTTFDWRKTHICFTMRLNSCTCMFVNGYVLILKTVRCEHEALLHWLNSFTT